MSAILSADDLNDFISPGVACIKPVETLPKEEVLNPYEVTTEDKVQAKTPAPASISLTDCLACSGCVTSAEAVLISLQSHTEVLNTLDAHTNLDVSNRISDTNGAGAQSEFVLDDAKLFVASVSPQVRASLAATFGISEEQAGYMIEQFLGGPYGLRKGGQNSSHFAYVIDTTHVREVSQVLCANEVANSIVSESVSRPVLTSACPGWVCYAEKTHPYVLPHMSRVKSPQALSGTLLKSVLSRQLHIHPSQIWHLALMPCFDKKLEASREELTDRWWRSPSHRNDTEPGIRDVDCVITSRELLRLADTRGIHLTSLPLRPLTQTGRHAFPDQRFERFLYPKPRRRREPQVDAGTSGGYLYHVLKTRQSENPGSSISIQRGRNVDVVEYTLLSSARKPIFKCARYYGFRNIQNLVRKLKPPRQSKLPGAIVRKVSSKASEGVDYAYIEVMACPGGCTNGGGQMRIEDVQNILPLTRGEEVQTINAQSQKEWLSRVDEAYFSAGSDEDGDVGMDGCLDPQQVGDDVVNGVSTKDVHDLLVHWSDLVDVPIDKLVYTAYRQVESDVGKGKHLDDSQRIAQIAGMSGGGW